METKTQYKEQMTPEEFATWAEQKRDQREALYRMAEDHKITKDTKLALLVKISGGLDEYEN